MPSAIAPGILSGLFGCQSGALDSRSIRTMSVKQITTAALIPRIAVMSSIIAPMMLRHYSGFWNFRFRVIFGVSAW
jgi:hypothetical protein